LPRSNCPACGAPGVALFSRAYADDKLRSALTAFYAQVGGLDYSVLSGATYSVASCPQCGSLFQTSIPSDAVLALLYEDWIDPEKARLRFHHGQPFQHYLGLSQAVALNRSLVAPDAPRTSLDYGCGWGEWSRMAQAFGHEAWGTELSPSRREHAQRMGIRIVAEADLPEDYFALINADQVLEHLPDPGACLRLLAKRLHPAGVLRLAVPNAWRVAAALKNFDHEIARPRLGRINAIAPLEHLNAFTQTGLLRLAADAGLERVRPRLKLVRATSFVQTGVLAKIKASLLPFYLRGSHSTQLYFRRAATHR